MRQGYPRKHVNLEPFVHGSTALIPTIWDEDDDGLLGSSADAQRRTVAATPRSRRRIGQSRAGSDVWAYYQCAGEAEATLLLYGPEGNADDRQRVPVPDIRQRSIVALEVPPGGARPPTCTAALVSDPAWYAFVHQHAPPTRPSPPEPPTPFAPDSFVPWDPSLEAWNEFGLALGDYAAKWADYVQALGLYDAEGPLPGDPLLFLTSAHCLFDEFGVPVSPIRVCRTADPGSCVGWPARDAEFAATDPEWDPHSQPIEHDWALLVVRDVPSVVPIGASPASLLEALGKPFRLSSLAPDTLQYLEYIKTAGFPLHGRNGCTGTNTEMFDEFVAMQDVQPGKLLWFADASAGQSGSPIYTCPDGASGNCEDLAGDWDGYIVGVLQGWHPTGTGHPRWHSQQLIDGTTEWVQGDPVATAIFSTDTTAVRDAMDQAAFTLLGNVMP